MALPSARFRNASFQCARAVREALEKALDRSGLTREIVARELSRLVGESVVPEQVAGWSESYGPHVSIPVEYLAALTVIFDDETIARAAFLPVEIPSGKARREVSPTGERGAEEQGQSRKPVPHLVRAWMATELITTNDVASALGVSPVAVRRWILGSMTSAKMRQWFLERGCPPHILGTDGRKKTEGKGLPR